MHYYWLQYFFRFQLTRLLRGVTRIVSRIFGVREAFQLTRLLRGVTLNANDGVTSKAFQLTRLLRGVTKSAAGTSWRSTFQLTRLLRGVTAVNVFHIPKYLISTHTPLARRDAEIRATK